MKNKCYHYCAKNSFGELISGEIEGLSRKDVFVLLGEQNFFVLDLYEKKRLVEWIEKERDFRIGKISFLTISQFAKDLSILLKAGIAISEALEILAKQVRDQRFSKAIQGFAEKIRGGEALSFAMAQKKRIFSELFIFFIKTGETGGNLAEMLEVSADYYQRVYDNRQKMKEILFYPLLLMMVSIGVIFFLLIAVLPQFMQLFDAIGEALPWPTMVLLNASKFLRDYGSIFLIGFVSLAIAVILFSEQPVLKKIIDLLRVKIPVYGKLRLWEFMMMISKNMGILLNTGVDLMTVLRGLEAVTANSLYKDAIMKMEKAVSNGKSLSEAMAETRVFQETFIQFTKIGESTGSIGEMMDLNAEFYKSQYNHGVNMLKIIVEPLLILILGMIVLFVLLAIMLPVFDLYLFYSNM